MSDTAVRGGNEIGLGTLLLIVFVVLKLTGVIDWSWWWVTAPVWGPLAFASALFGVAGLLTAASKSGESR